MDDVKQMRREFLNALVPQLLGGLALACTLTSMACKKPPSVSFISRLSASSSAVSHSLTLEIEDRKAGKKDEASFLILPPDGSNMDDAFSTVTVDFGATASSVSRKHSSPGVTIKNPNGDIVFYPYKDPAVLNEAVEAVHELEGNLSGTHQATFVASPNLSN